MYVSQPTWEEEAGPRPWSIPTIEVRVMDSATSRRLFAEITVLVAAFVHHCGDAGVPYQCTAQEYKDMLTNHWAAARDGMQATFRWDCGSRPVVEVLEEMLNEVDAELAALGASSHDLHLVRTCIAKRLCQADAFADIAERYLDCHTLTSAYAKLCRGWDWGGENPCLGVGFGGRESGQICFDLPITSEWIPGLMKGRANGRVSSVGKRHWVSG